MDTYRTIRAAQIAAALIEAAEIEVRKMAKCKIEIERGEGRPCAVRKAFAKAAERANISVFRAEKFLKNCPEFTEIQKRRDNLEGLLNLHFRIIDFFAK